jgi:selenocysteine lyase/cysteine desulfurase
MGSAVLPWQIACNTTGANLNIITKDINSVQDISWTDLIISEICNNNNIAIIAVPNVHWCDGSIIDLIKISSTLDNIIYDNENNQKPLLIIDGTQSIGVLPIDIKLIKPTFVACSIHKWLCGPYGLSIVYIDSKYHSIWNPIDNHEKCLIGNDDILIWDEIGAMNNKTGYPINYMNGKKKI